MEIYEKLHHPLAFSIFIFTLFLPILVGIIAMKRAKNQSDFFVGGRSMNKFVVALSAVSSGRSIWLVLGLSGIAYGRGTAAVWAAVGYIVVELFQFIYIGRKLRKDTERFNSITMLDYFADRFKDKMHLLRITGVVIISVFMTIYVAGQFYGGAKTLNTALNIPVPWALIISAVLILVYMMLGGYIAVAYNDVVRAIIMIFGLVVLPVYGLIKIGGFDVLMDAVSKLNPAYVDPFSLAFGVFAGFIGIGLGSPGQPHIVVRYMSIDDPDKLRFSAMIGTVWNVVMAWGAVFIGLLGRYLVPVAANLPDKDPERVYLVLSSQFLDPVLYGLLIGGVFAAILSTADSMLLVVASTFARDLYEKIIKKGKGGSAATQLKIGRITLLICGVFSLLLAYIIKDSLFWLVLFAWGGLGAAFGPALIFSLYWKRTSKWGIFAGMVTGSVVAVVWREWIKKITGIYELIPAFFLAALVIYVVSLLTPPPRQDE